MPLPKSRQHEFTEAETRGPSHKTGECWQANELGETRNRSGPEFLQRKCGPVILILDSGLQKYKRINPLFCHLLVVIFYGSLRKTNTRSKRLWATCSECIQL